MRRLYRAQRLERRTGRDAVTNSVEVRLELHSEQFKAGSPQTFIRSALEDNRTFVWG